MTNEEVICKKLAQDLQHRDWHKLSLMQRELVADLEQAGYLEIKPLPNGFVGKAQ